MSGSAVKAITRWLHPGQGLPLADAIQANTAAVERLTDALEGLTESITRGNER